MPNIVRPGRIPLPGQSATGFKPNPWNVQKRYIAPEWRWAWEDNEFPAPLWSGGGTPRLVLPDDPADSLLGNEVWSRDQFGHQFGWDGGGTQWYARWNRSSGDRWEAGNEYTVEVMCFVNELDSTNGNGDQSIIFAHGGWPNLPFQTYLERGTDGSAPHAFTFENTDGSGREAYVTGPQPSPPAIVHGIAVVRQGVTDGTEWFVDDTSQGTDTTSTISQEATTIGFGQRNDGGEGSLDGAVILANYWPTTALNRAQIHQRFRDPFGWVRPAQQVIVSVPGGADVTLTADSGTYSVTGSNADLLRDLLITGESGSYSVTGSDADLLRSLLMSGDAGTYSVTGSDADLLRALQMTADAGSYSVTGQTADLLRALLLDAESGTYTVTGSAADLIVSGAITMTADAGSYSISGADADLLRDLQFTAESGSYTVTGQPADLLRALLIAAEAGGYNVTGQDADVLLDRILSADAGTYSLSGQDADLVLSAAFKALNIAVSVDQPLDLSASVDQPLDMDADVDQPLNMDVDVEPQE